MYLWCGLCAANRRLGATLDKTTENSIPQWSNSTIAEDNSKTTPERTLQQYQTLAELAEIEIRNQIPTVSDPACIDFLQNDVCYHEQI